MLNPYTISFVTAVAVYIALFSKLNDTEENSSNWLHMESAMYSVGAAAIGFAIVYFLNHRNVVGGGSGDAAPSAGGGVILNNRPSVVNTKAAVAPVNSTIGSTGEIVMKGPFQ